jgi:glycine/D-amino acid oxidase-like deaminating enzyme
VAPSPSPIFRGTLQTDVAVVGAGIAGLSTAFHLSGQGVEVVVLDAGSGASSATAASAGVVAPQLVRTTPNGVLGRLGQERGARLLNLLADSGRYVFDLIRAETLDCAAQPYGFIKPVAGGAAAYQLRSLIEEWAPFRTDLTFADADETRELTGCQGYCASLVDPSGGGLDPVAYVQGLAAKLPASLVRLFRETSVISIRREGAQWALRTAEGVLLAKRVVLCANGGNTRLHPALAKTVLPLPVYEVATTPLAPSVRAEVLPHGHALTDSSTDVFSIRFDGDGRLITACSASAVLGREALTAQINRRLVATIPGYAATALDYAWKGTAWLNSDLLPRVLTVDDGLLAIQACNGRGIGLSTIIGREVARLLAQPDTYQPLVPLQKPQPVAGYGLARHLPGLMMLGAALGTKLRRATTERIQP